MKVKVRRIAAPYIDVPTSSLQAVLRNHAHDRLHVRIGTEQLYAIMEELARRREASDQPFRSSEDAWAEFVRCYMPIELTPSWHGEKCLGNGEHEYECRCDECDHYLECFPDWEEAMRQPY